MTYIQNPIKYVGLENKRWTYQDYSAGSITGTSVTLSQNQNGTNSDGSALAFSSSNIIDSTALIVRSDNSKSVQRNGFTGFLNKVKVSSHSGTSITLSHVPNLSAPIRIWYQYSETVSDIKNQGARPPILTAKQIEDMGTIINTKADASIASVSEAGSLAQITTSDTVLTAFGKVMKWYSSKISSIGTIGFQAKTSAHVQSTGRIVFDSVTYNLGSHYNASTGVFTAPKTGVYLFGFTTLLWTLGYSSHVILRKNGSAFDGDGSLGIYGSFTGTYAGQGGSTTVYLTTGDTVDFYFNYFGTNLHSGYTKAFGHFLG